MRFQSVDWVYKVDKKNKILVAVFIIFAAMVLARVVLAVSCAYGMQNNNGSSQPGFEGNAEGNNTMNGYISITMEEAKTIFETKGDYIILDVRRPDEFASGHIPGAINVANESIVDTQPEQLPNKDQVIYVYCRSGNRSKQASQKLADMGYTKIIEFGGIIDWTGAVEE